MPEVSKKANLEALEESELQRVLCIYYSAQFGKISINTLIDSSSKVNIIYPSFVRKLDLQICKIDADTQKIDSYRLETFRMVITLF